jgi:hypothetical protein
MRAGHRRLVTAIGVKRQRRKPRWEVYRGGRNPCGTSFFVVTGGDLEGCITQRRIEGRRQSPKGSAVPIARGARAERPCSAWTSRAAAVGRSVTVAAGSQRPSHPRAESDTLISHPCEMTVPRARKRTGCRSHRSTSRPQPTASQRAPLRRATRWGLPGPAPDPGRARPRPAGRHRHTLPPSAVVLKASNSDRITLHAQGMLKTSSVTSEHPDPQ